MNADGKIKSIVPQQENGIDCGVFTVKFTRAIVNHMSELCQSNPGNLDRTDWLCSKLREILPPEDFTQQLIDQERSELHFQLTKVIKPAYTIRKTFESLRKAKEKDAQREERRAKTAAENAARVVEAAEPLSIANPTEEMDEDETQAQTSLDMPDNSDDEEDKQPNDGNDGNMDVDEDSEVSGQEDDGTSRLKSFIKFPHSIYSGDQLPSSSPNNPPSSNNDLDFLRSTASRNVDDLEDQETQSEEMQGTQTTDPQM